VRYPKCLYQTPDGWCPYGREQFWLSRSELAQTVRDLRRIGVEAAMDAARAWLHVGGGVYEDVVGPARPEDGWFHRPLERRVRLWYDQIRRAWFIEEVLEWHR
jgi:hypothetical protein